MNSFEQTSTEQAHVVQEPLRRRRGIIWIAAAALAVLLLAAGILPRIARYQRAARLANAAAASYLNVNLVPAKLARSSSELELPGNMEPINVATIYARANGYIQERFVDIGSRVRAGQVLAIIASPEVDQELSQARAGVEQAQASLEQAKANLSQAQAQVTQAKANIAQAQANEEIAATTDARWTRLVRNGVLPKQQGDERRSAYAARQAETQAALAAETTAEANIGSRKADVIAGQAAIDAQRANVRRLEQMQAFERVLAPFDGVVTERRVEKGDLVSAGGNDNRNLFSVSQGNILRIQVSVPQTYAVDLERGQEAQVTVRERPGEKFTGNVARTAGSLAEATRTLLTEVQVDNSSGRLLPGMYAQVKFVLPRSHPVVIVPGNTLLVNAQGTRVVEVTNDRAHILPVQLGRDLGSQVEVLSGLEGTEMLVSNPPDTLADGQQVSAAAPEAKQ